MILTHLVLLELFDGAGPVAVQTYVRYRKPLNKTEQDVASIQITNYSDQEKLIGSWQEDGVTKKLYRKHIDLTQAFLETNATEIAHDILNLDKVIKISAVVEVSSEFIPLPKATTTEVTDMKITSSKITSVITGSPSWTGFSNGYVILEYTKTAP